MTRVLSATARPPGSAGARQQKTHDGSVERRHVGVRRDWARTRATADQLVAKAERRTAKHETAISARSSDSSRWQGVAQVLRNTRESRANFERQVGKGEAEIVRALRRAGLIDVISASYTGDVELGDDDIWRTTHFTIDIKEVLRIDGSYWTAQ